MVRLTWGIACFATAGLGVVFYVVMVIIMPRDESGVAIGDLDGDGDLDAFVANVNFGGANEVWIDNSSHE